MLPDELKCPIKKWIEDNGLFALIIIGCTITALFSLFFFKADNLIEQAMEKQIEHLSGVKVDFTP